MLDSVQLTALLTNVLYDLAKILTNSRFHDSFLYTDLEERLKMYVK